MLHLVNSDSILALVEGRNVGVVGSSVDLNDLVIIMEVKLTLTFNIGVLIVLEHHLRIIDHQFMILILGLKFIKIN